MLRIRHHSRLHFDKHIFVSIRHQKIQDYIFDHIWRQLYQLDIDMHQLLDHMVHHLYNHI